MTVLASLFAAMLLTCLGVALALLGSAATTLAMHDGQAAAAGYAAQAALSLASAEVRARADWSGVLATALADVCAAPGAFVDASLFPRAPWDGSTIDLHTLTAVRQVDRDIAAPPAAAAAPVWCLFEYGPISRLVPSEARRYPLYVTVWTAGGSDGLVLLHATALGAGGLRASVETSIRPPRDGAAVARQATRSVP